MRARGAQRARELLPLDALLETYLIGQRTFWEAIVAAAGDTPEGPAGRAGADGVHLRYTHAINVAVAEALPGREPRAGLRGRARPPRPARPPALRPPARADEERRAEALGLRPRRRGRRRAQRAGRACARWRARARSSSRAMTRSIGIAPLAPARAARRRSRAPPRLERIHGSTLRAGVSTHAARRWRSSAAATSRPAARSRHAGAGRRCAWRRSRSSTTWPRPPTRPPTCCSRPASTSSRRWPRRCSAYADCDLNVARAAELLNVHANTVHYRLRRVQELTGRDPRRFAELVELTTALRIIAM